MHHTTGSCFPMPNSIGIEVDEVGAISAHTCSKVLRFPKNFFNDNNYELFVSMMKAVIGQDTFNTV